MFDTSTSNVGTMESGPNTYPAEVGAPTKPGLFSPEDTVMVNVKMKGRMIFEDSLGICRFMSRVSLGKVCEAVNAVTGWDYDVPEAMDMGRRVVHMLRVFNLRHGMDTSTERPGPRYGSTPIDGPAMGKAIAPHWDDMLKLYYEQMGWDANGRPLPETLRQIGLEGIIPDLEAVK